MTYTRNFTTCCLIPTILQLSYTNRMPYKTIHFSSDTGHPGVRARFCVTERLPPSPSLQTPAARARSSGGLHFTFTFTFKVIIDIYVPIAIFLIVWGLFLWSFFFPTSFVLFSYILMTILALCLSCSCIVCLYHSFF